MSYQFEPRKRSEESTKKKSKRPEFPELSNNARRESSSWCLCGRCDVMPTEQECVCCREFDAVSTMLSEGSIQCVTLHPRFSSVCLQEDVLRAVLVLLHDMQSSNLEEPISNRCVLRIILRHNNTNSDGFRNITHMSSAK